MISYEQTMNHQFNRLNHLKDMLSSVENISDSYYNDL
jgi:regulatory protein YycI of two-component signal transduction system YycFG